MFRLHVTTLEVDPWQDDIPSSHPQETRGWVFYAHDTNHQLVFLTRFFLRDHELADVWLRPIDRHHGKGQAYVQKVLAALRRRQIHTLWLWCVTSLRPFWLRMGFQPTKMSPPLRQHLQQQHPWLKHRKLHQLRRTL